MPSNMAASSAAIANLMFFFTVTSFKGPIAIVAWALRSAILRSGGGHKAGPVRTRHIRPRCCRCFRERLSIGMEMCLCAEAPNDQRHTTTRASFVSESGGYMPAPWMLE